MDLNKVKEISSIITVGDIHGEYKKLKFLLKNKNINDAVICLAGDIGMGFNKPNYYKTMFTWLNKFCIEHNIYIFAVRGNHDNPDYFDGTWEYSNLMLVPDYYILETKEDKILFVGGGISIDKEYRTLNVSYWAGEQVVYKPEISKTNTGITIVVSHSSPAFCEPHLKVKSNDLHLMEECALERKILTDVYYDLIESGNKIFAWCYGHFHFYNFAIIDDVKFIAHDIDQLVEIRR